MTFYCSNSYQKAIQTIFRDERTVYTAGELAEVLSVDHSPVKMRDGKRCDDNFLLSDCVVMDSDDGATAGDISRAFAGIVHFIAPSRNHMKEKHGVTCERYHVYFPTNPINDKNLYKGLKATTQAYFPEFDKGAIAATQFYYGVEKPTVKEIAGEMYLDEFMIMCGLWNSEEDSMLEIPSVITQGQRNKTVHDLTCGALVKFGATDGRAYDFFNECVSRCSPPLSQREIDKIWNQGLKFFQAKVENDPTYNQPTKKELYQTKKKISVPAEVGDLNTTGIYQPGDYTDLGQANVFNEVFGQEVRYSTATKFLHFDGKRWTEDEIRVQGLSQRLTDLQLTEVRQRVRKAQDELNEAVEKGNTADILSKKMILAAELEYRKYVLNRRKSDKIKSTLTEVRPMVEISVDQLDRDGYLLNTPDGTVDLRTGELRGHDAKDYCTKMTNVSPSKDKRSLADFKQALAGIGCETRRTKNGAVVYGIREKAEDFRPAGEDNPFENVG